MPVMNFYGHQEKKVDETAPAAPAAPAERKALEQRQDNTNNNSNSNSNSKGSTWLLEKCPNRGIACCVSHTSATSGPVYPYYISIQY
jgi:hypothetical protein